MESSGSGRGWRLDSGRCWILLRLGLGRSMDPAANVIAVGHAARVGLPLAPSGLDMYTCTARCAVVHSSCGDIAVERNSDGLLSNF